MHPITSFTSALSAPLRSHRTHRAARADRPGAPRGRRGFAIAALVASAAVVAGGTVAFGAANKTITLDVDGKVTRVTTYAGSVEGFLEKNDIEVGERDTVAPETSSALTDGSEIVVRYAKRVDVQVDGVQTEVWTTALSADEALTTLASRGADVRLVASRSAAGGRAALPIELTLDGPVDVAVDGQILTARDGSLGLAAVLDELGVVLTEYDRVSVQDSTTGAVTIVVSRVVVADVAESQPIAFESVDQPDPARYVGQKKVTTVGVEGQRTIVNRITTVDGVETARELISDAVVAAPVGQIVSVGTKVRPVVVATPAPAASSGAAADPNVGGSADSLNWAALAACESGGRPTAVSASGAYHGLYQFSVSTWGSVGGSGLPSAAPADEQTMRAKMLYNRSGAGQWPHCGPRLFS
ncbi:resuscitation-promoting factor [Pengzhenrongella frigida]|uniref:resuscitation-promoting factor n=1 Tax=Pengzhenrongella frigida TaxID=1259133 RepID=UPI001F5E3398|nr:resuscitation-promoting factor [Cellulomonas sp. HLT2-17]